MKDKKLIKLHTLFQVKEDSQTLFGFFELEEKAIFELLISVSGVGGNTALTILSSISVQDLKQAIFENNVSRLKQIKGIGEKTAARITLELKDKVGSLKTTGKLMVNSRDSIKNEALNALISLGFTKALMEKKIDSIIAANAELTVEDVIKLALKN